MILQREQEPLARITNNPVKMAMIRKSDPFPLHAICGYVWKNTEGQLSFLKYAVTASPEVFTFAHSGRQLTYEDAAFVYQFPSAWSSIDLLEVFCLLSERGHASLERSILVNPLSSCPEVLLLGMLILHIISFRTRWLLLLFHWYLKMLLGIVQSLLSGVSIQTCYCEGL